MKIALLGYGKMGRIIDQIASQRGHDVVLKAGREGFKDEDLQRADLAIDFSLPSVAFSNITRCLENNVPVVSGTTGWLDRMAEVEQLCKEKNGSFIYGSNFSLGVNLFFALNEHLAKLMNGHTTYSAHMTEIHHTQKLDAPSGTAISLAEGMLKNLENYNGWKLVESEETLDENILPIEAERIDPTPGTHIITYDSEVDAIEIKHTAHSRNGFALGAVIAAEYLIKNPGIRTMKDVLGLHNL